MKPETIRETVRTWEQQPDKAKGKPMVKARSDGAQAVLEAGPLTWRADLPPPLGGTNQAPSPTAQLLGALAGCAVVLIRDTLGPQLGIRVDAVEATVQCETDTRGLLSMSGVAPDLENIQINIQIQSPDGEAAAQKLYQAWQQRCPVYLALTKPMKVTTAMQHKPS
jgi:uncharacterized OsmC-like protein